MQQLPANRKFRSFLFTALFAIQFIAFGVLAAPATTTVEDRMSAVNRALEQSLDERAKSQHEFERNAAAGRPRESKQMRKLQREERGHARLANVLTTRESQNERGHSRYDRTSRDDSDSREFRAETRREELRREKRLNWLND